MAVFQAHWGVTAKQWYESHGGVPRRQAHTSISPRFSLYYVPSAWTGCPRLKREESLDVARPWQQHQHHLLPELFSAITASRQGIEGATAACLPRQTRRSEEEIWIRGQCWAELVLCAQNADAQRRRVLRARGSAPTDE